MGLWAKLSTFFHEREEVTAVANLAMPKESESAQEKRLLLKCEQNGLPDFSHVEAEHLYLCAWLEIDSAKELQPSIPTPLKLKLLDEAYRQAAVPRLPAVLPKLMRALRDPEVTARDCIELIRQDAALLASVLQIANSSFYRPGGGEALDIEQAVVSLGIEGLRRVVCAALVKPIAKRADTHSEHKGGDIWQYSLRTALAAEALAHVHGVDSFVAYLLGLCQGLGYTTLYNEFLKHWRENNRVPDNRAIAEACLVFGNELSAEIVSDWPMPDELGKQLMAFAEFSKAVHEEKAAERSGTYAGTCASTYVGTYVTLLQQAVYISRLYSLEQQGLLPENLWEQLCEGGHLPLGLLGQLSESSF
ncbi:HDOD domain-containing protein [Pseudoteredinibacter isoporae]|uniref:HD-like signal output (HDOD) protein n=1 Tax=Pseudoteredinibacter isoporae TaxID=570281 RepID=A0A7X0JSP9_9GAMM|nr:HDOD domain-containing protein [Pseudoteredinibacter isoporae]MBB6521437.1 HD-like signal output (HDOD) protein [Pseudoteredinibacter isoporae]NHO86991.1 HDOD domain-containing protein [Pseudoteredinibacter isoporae]NIB24556.1 HDOD domain-containing protein [Pseudoteredinibacter isoporae]